MGAEGHSAVCPGRRVGNKLTRAFQEQEVLGENRRGERGGPASCGALGSEELTVGQDQPAGPEGTSRGNGREGRPRVRKQPVQGHTRQAAPAGFQAQLCSWSS